MPTVPIAALGPQQWRVELLGGPESLAAGAPSKDGFAPALFPCFLGSWPRLSGVLVPCVVLCTARACARLLPNSQGDRRPVCQWTECVAVAPAQGDRGLELSGQKPPDPDPDMPALLMFAPRARRTDRTLIGPGAEDQATRPFPTDFSLLGSRAVRPGFYGLPSQRLD
jgi:hypothetical protein